MLKSSWKSTLSALAMTAVFAAGVTVSAPTWADELKVSNAVGKKLQEAMKLAGEKKVTEAQVKAKEAQSLAKTAYDTFKAYDVLAYVDLKAGDYAGALRAYEEIIDSQYLEAANRQQYTKTMTQLYFQTKSYGKTIEYGQRWIKNYPGELDPVVLVGQSYFLQKDCKNAARFMDQAIDLSQSTGKGPKENFFLIKLQCATDAKNVAGQIDALQDLAARYPKREYWSGLLTLSNRDVPDRTTQHFYRLKLDTETLTSADEYVEMAQLAIQFGYPGEAQQVLERGFANKTLENESAERNRRLLESAKKDAEGDKKTLPMQDKEARNQKTGEADVQLGFTYLIFGDATHAVEALERGIGKGGVKSPAEAQIFLGMAYLKAKRSDDAKKAFRAAKDDQLLGRVAKLWMIRADQA